MIRYYDIEGCEIEIINNVRVLTAPASTPRYLLLAYNFLQASDGRWMRIITQEELQHLMGEGHGKVLAGVDAPISEADKKKANKFEAIGVTSLILAACLFSAAVFLNTDYWIVWIGFALNIVAFVMMVILRAKHKNSIIGKILMVFFVLIGASAIAGCIFIVSIFTAK